MTSAAYARIARGKPMLGVIIVPQWLAIGLAAEDLSIIAECSTPSDWANQVGFLPLRTDTRS
jgi:hypothetical protein